jgi:hypothetical protein
MEILLRHERLSSFSILLANGPEPRKAGECHLNFAEGCHLYSALTLALRIIMVLTRSLWPGWGPIYCFCSSRDTTIKRINAAGAGQWSSVPKGVSEQPLEAAAHCALTPTGGLL